MLKKTLLMAVVFCLIWCQMGLSNSQKPWVHFMIRVHEPFWDLYFAYANNAGKDLGVKVTATWGVDANNYIYYINETKKLLSSTEKPDVICFNNFHDCADDLIELAQYYGTNAITINSAMSKKQLLKVGNKPRAKHDKWIGQILPDDPGSSEAIVNQLIAATKKNLGKVNIVLMNGPEKAGAAIGRGAGFEAAIKNHPDVRVLQRVNLPAWTADAAKEGFRKILRKFNNVNAVFGANGNILVGLVEVAKDAEYELGIDLFIGGMDIDENVAAFLKKNELVASAGGHFIEGGFVVVLAHDYLKGNDFAQESTEYRSPMLIATPKNINSIQGLFTIGGEDMIDFS